MTDVTNAEQPRVADSVTDANSAAAAFKSMGLFSGAPAPLDPGAEPEQPEEQSTDEATASDVQADDLPDEPTGEDGGEQAEAQTEYFTVKIDGKEERVTRDELLAGYQKDKDYRLKTAKLADERKALEQEREVIKQVQAERQHLASMLQNVVPTLEKQLQDKYQNVDWVKLGNENPAEGFRLRMEYEADLQKLSHARSEQARVQQAQADDFQKSHQKFLEDQSRLLAEKIPEFADADKGPKFKTELKSFLKEQGLNETEISGIADHRMVVIARKAMLYDKALKSKTAAANTAKPVPQVQKPGASPRTDVKGEIRKSAMAKLAKTGRVDDAAAVFRTMKIFG